MNLHERHSLPSRLSLALLCVSVVAGLSTVPARGAAAPTGILLVAGTSAVTDHSTGRTWSPDTQYARGGTVRYRSQSVVGASDQALYQTQRFGQSGYTIPVPNGNYAVTLNSDEPYWTRAGQRSFDVVAQGISQARGVDIFRAVGQFHAYQISFVVAVTDSVLDIDLVGHQDNPIVDSLSVMPIPTAPAPVNTLTPESYGAKGDGVSDDTVALQKAFDNAGSRPVLLTAGRSYVHSGVLYLRTDGLHVTGAGTLMATKESTSSVWIRANGVTVDGGVTFATAHTTQRWSAWEQMGLRLEAYTGITLRNVIVSGSAAAGIYVGGSDHFVLDHVTVRNTRADGIHMTAGANNGQVISPMIVNSGDDGVAVVSYGSDASTCHDITVTAPVVDGTSGGRGISVVGGTNITETAIDVRNTAAAAVYIAAEGAPWYTTAPANVVVSGGTITGANTDTGIDHGAVLVVSGQPSSAPTMISVTGLAINSTRATASRDIGVITYGMAPQSVLFADLVITGGPTNAYQGNTPQSSFRTRNIMQNRIPLRNLG